MNARSGMTLLEVVVGLILVAGLVVASLLALTRHEQSLKVIERRQQAIQLAENLLASWVELPGGFPVAAIGISNDEAMLRWQTRVVGERILCGVAVQIVRLEIYDPVVAPENQAAASMQLLCSVEVVRRFQPGE